MSKTKQFDLSDYLNSPEVNDYVSNLEARQQRARQAAMPTSPQQIEHAAGLDRYSNEQLRQIGNDAAAERNTNWATDRWNSVRGGVGQLFSMAGTAMDDPAAAAGATGVAAADMVLSGPLRLASQVSKWAGGDGSLPFDADKGAQFIHESLLPAMQYWGDKLADARSKNDADNTASSTVRGVGQLISDDAQASMSPQAKQRNAQYEATKGFGALGFLATNPTKALDMVLENLPSQLPMLGAGRAAGTLSNVISENAGKAAAAEAMMTPQFRAAMAIGSQKAKDSAMVAVQAAAKDAVEAAAAKSAPILTGLNVALEAGTTGAQTTDAIFNAVGNAKQEDIAKNPVYQQLLKETGSDAAARNKLAGRLSAEWAPLASFGTALGSLVTGGAHAEAMALAGRVVGYKEKAKNVGKEMLEEAIQNPLEDAAQYGAERQVNPNANYDPIKSALEGAVVSMGHSGAVQFAKPASDSIRGIVARSQAQTGVPQPEVHPTPAPSEPTQRQAEQSGYDPIAPNQDDLLRRMGVQPDPAADAAAASVESVLGVGDPTAGLVASVMRGDALQPVHDLAAVRTQQVLQPTASEGGLFEPKWLPDAAGGESIDGLPLPKYGVDSQEKRLANMGLDARDAQKRQAIDAHKQASFAAIDAMIARQKAAELEQLHQDSVVPAAIDRADTANQINQALADAAGEGVAAPNAMQLALQAAQQKAMPAKAVTANTVPGNNATFKAAPNISAAAPNIAEEAPNISRDDNSRQLTPSDAGIDSNASPALTMQQTERGQWLIKGDMAQHVQAIREALPGTKLVVSQQKGQALVQMPADKNTAKQGKQIRKALDHLLLSGEQLAQRDAQRMAAGERAKAQNRQARQIDHGSDDILQAVAKLGGINTEQALSEWWRGQPETIGHYNGEIPGNLRRQGVFAFKRQGGLPIDDMVRRLEGEGYLHDGATPNDLLDAIEQRRLHPAGMEQRARQEYEARQQEEAPGEFQQAYHDGEFADEFTKRELEETDYFELNRQQREAAEAAADAAAVAQYEQENAKWDATLSQSGKSYADMDIEDALNEIFGPQQTAAGQNQQGEKTSGGDDTGRGGAGSEGGRTVDSTESAQDGFGLSSYTASDLQRQEREAEQRRVDDERQRAAADKARQDEETRKEIRRRSEAAADSFTLGGNAEDNLTGQGGLFDAPGNANRPGVATISKSDGSGFATREALRTAATKSGIEMDRLIEKRDDSGNWIGTLFIPDSTIDGIIADAVRAGKLIGTSVRDLHADDVRTVLMAAHSAKQLEAMAGYLSSYSPRAAAETVQGQLDTVRKWKGWATDESLYGGGLFDAPAQEPAKPSRITEESAGNMRAGDVVRDGKGDKYLALGARHKWLEVAPIVNGKAQISADTTFKFHLDPETADAYPERRSDPVYATGESLSERTDSETESSSAQNTGHSPGNTAETPQNAASSAATSAAIDALVAAGERRRDAGEPPRKRGDSLAYAPPPGDGDYNNPRNWLTENELNRLHELQQSLPSAASEREAAQARIKQKLEARKSAMPQKLASRKPGPQNGIQDKMRGLAEQAIAGGNDNLTVSMATVPGWVADAVDHYLGVDVSGFHHAADMYAIRHTLKNHGDAAKEKLRGQLPVTEEDIAQIPEAVGSPDSIIIGVKNERNQDLIVSVKQMPNGTALLVEEIRTGRKTLSLVSVRKVPGAKNAKELLPSVLPNVRNDTGVKPIIVDAPGVRHSFAGRSARTADAHALSNAQSRLDVGDDAETVRQDTGWFKGADGQWRFEIDDSNARLLPLLRALQGGGHQSKRIASVTYRNVSPGRFDVVLNPENAQTTSDFVHLDNVDESVLTALVPEHVVDGMMRGDGSADFIGANLEDAHNMRAAFDFDGMNALPLDHVLDHPALFAAYPALRDVMVQVDPKLGNGGAFTLRDDGTRVIKVGSGQQLGTLLHEIQHGIQDVEGFASGGSSTMLAESMPEPLAINDAKVLRMRRDRGDSADDASVWFLNNIGRDAHPDARYLSSLYSTEELRKMPGTPQEKYRRLAGEVEARNVQARADMTAEQRRATPPSQTADVADQHVILVYNGKEMAHAPAIANAATTQQRQSGMQPAELEALLRKVLPAHLQGKVKVVRTAAELPQGGHRAQDGSGIDGVYLPATGELYLVADAFDSPERALFVLAHELAHYGLRAKFGVDVQDEVLAARSNMVIGKLADAIARDRGMTIATVRRELSERTGLPIEQIGLRTAKYQLQVETAEEALAELNAAIERNDFAYLQDRYGVKVPNIMRNDLRARIGRFVEAIKGWLAKLTGKTADSYSDKQVWDLLAGVRETVRNGGNMAESDGAAQHSMAASSKTINVDGVIRPTTNSNGQPIAQTEEGLRNFWRWFGDSKVVDKDGKPLVVYHGTASTFYAFDPGAVGSNYQSDSKGFFFTSSSAQAEVHATDAEFSFNGNAERNIVPAYLAVQNPAEFETDGNPNAWYDANTDYALNTAEQNGGDGITVAGKDGETLYVAFYPEQIKSAVGNQGTFNGSDPNILRSTAQKQPASAGFSLPEETKPQAAQRQVQDSMNRWQQVLDQVREQGGQVDERNDVYGAEERFHGRAATRIEDFAREEVEPLMQRLADSGHTLREIEQFLLAQHAEEANARIREIDDSRDTAFGMEDGEAQSILAKFAAMPDAAEFKRLANDFRSIADGTLALYEHAGIIAPDAALAMNRAYQYYVPVKGGDEDQAARQGTGKGLSVNGKQKRRMGHDMRDEHVLENLMRDRQRAIILAEKNNVGTYLLDLIERNPDPKLWTVDVLPKQKVLRNQVSFAVERNGQIVDSFTDIDAAERFIDREVLRGTGQASEFNILKSSDPYVSMMAKPMMQENEVQVYVKGQPVRIQLHDPILARQYRRMGTEQLGRLVEAGKEMNRWLSQAYTGYNPRFFVKNVARDAIAGTINLTAEQGAGMTAKAIMHWPKAGAAVFKFVMSGEVPNNEYGRALKRYRAAGGSTGAAYMGDLERQAKTLQRLHENYTGAWAAVKDGKPGRAAKIATRKLLGGIAHWFEIWNSAGENAFRLATFMAMEESGKTVAQAASMAKNVTVNFNRKGELTPQLGAAYLFLNPSIQGSQRMIKSLFGKDTPHKAQAWALVGGMAGLALMLAAMNRGDDEDEWEAIPNSVKDHNMIIPLGKGRKLTIPLPYDYGFFVSMANRLDAVMHGESAEKAAIKLASSFFESFSPVGNPIGEEPDGKNVINVMPTALKMVLQPAFNINGFGSPMRPDEAKEDMPDNLKMYRGTRGSLYDKAAQGISGGFEKIGIGSPYENNWSDVSPETLKYWVQTLTGGTGKFLADSASLLNVLASGAMPESDEVPIYDTMVRSTSVKDARARFYDLGKDAKAQVAAWKRANEAGDSKAAAEYESGEMLALGQMMDGYRQQATALRDLMAQEMQRDDLTLAEKRLKQKMYERQEADIYQEFIRQFKPH